MLENICIWKSSKFYKKGLIGNGGSRNFSYLEMDLFKLISLSYQNNRKHKQIQYCIFCVLKYFEIANFIKSFNQYLQ